MFEKNRSLIENLMMDYSESIDSKEYERWPELFTEDGHYRVTNSDDFYQGYKHGIIWVDSRGMMKDRVSALREANVYEEQGYRHLNSMVRVLKEDPDNNTLSLTSNFMVVRILHTGETHLFATGRYLDRIQIKDNVALFKERIVVCDSQRIDTLLAIPL